MINVSKETPWYGETTDVTSCQAARPREPSISRILNSTPICFYLRQPSCPASIDFSVPPCLISVLAAWQPSISVDVARHNIRLTSFRSLPACQINGHRARHVPVQPSLCCKEILSQEVSSVSQAPPHGIGDINPGVNRVTTRLVHLASCCSTPYRRGVPLTIARQVPGHSSACAQTLAKNRHTGCN